MHRWLSLIALLATYSAPARVRAVEPLPSVPITYTISPVMTGNELKAVVVDIRLIGGASGQTTLELPGDFGGVNDHWRFLSKLQVSGASVENDGAAKRLLHHVPGATIIVHYEIASAYSVDPTAGDGNPYNGAVIRPAWFAALGNFLFATPTGGDNAAATLNWKGWPADWTHVSDADHGTLGQAMTVDDVVESTLLAGPDVELRTRPIAGGVLRLATRGRWSWNLDAYADKMAHILSTERAFWGDVTGPFTVTLYQLAPGKSYSSSGGTGRGDGFAQYASLNISERELTDNIGHEHIHGWIPRRIGEMPDGEAAARLFWFSEGFTEFYTARTFLRAGIWTLQQFVDSLNGRLAAYASSPARGFPNAKIVTNFWTDPAVEQLPYRRGELFAYLLDRKLRQTGHANGLDAVMFAMRVRWVAAPAGAKPALLANFNAVIANLGLDVRAELARFIEAGEPIALASNQFTGCATVADITIPAFDPGFDRDASAAAGVFAGVDPNGAAYAAGLRNGMKRLARLGGREGDSREPLSYQVEDSGSVRVISWRPEGAKPLMFQEVKLVPGLSADAVTACAQKMSGA